MHLQSTNLMVYFFLLCQLQKLFPPAVMNIDRFIGEHIKWKKELCSLSHSCEFLVDPKTDSERVWHFEVASLKNDN